MSTIAALALLATAASLNAGTPTSVSPPPTPWDLRLEAGIRAPTSVTVVNRCFSVHRFSVALEPPTDWLRVEDGGGVEVPSGAAVPLAAEVDATALEPGFYQTGLVVRCLTCDAEPGCSQDEDRFTVRLAAAWNAEELARLDVDRRRLPGVLLAVLPAFPEGEQRRALRRLERGLGAESLRSFRLETLGVELVVLGTRERPFSPLLARLAAAPGVLWAQPSFRYHTQRGETRPPEAARRGGDPLADAQYGLSLLRAGEAHRRATGRGVRVAVIDTAVAAGHPDLAGRVAESRSFLEPEQRGRRQRRGESPGHRHGTAVAGLVAAARDNGIGMVGVAPDAELLAYEACRAEPGETVAACTTESLARALDAALAARARVINLSLGGPRDPLSARAVR